MSSEFNSASRYKPSEQKDNILKYTPMLTGVLILLIGVNYLSFAIKALGRGESFYAVVGLGIFGAFVAAFVLLRRGIALEAIYDNARYAKAPRFPRKTVAGGVLAISSALSAYLGEYSLISSLVLGGALFLGWYLYYGLDPRRDKIAGYDNSRSAERIMSLLVEARESIDSIKRSAEATASRELDDLMKSVAGAFETMVTHIEEEPDDYDRARKYLVSYLGELREMCEVYIKLEKHDRAEEMREAFTQTLTNAKQTLQKQYEKLLDDDLLGLDVKLSVMKQRLEHEE